MTSNLYATYVDTIDKENLLQAASDIYASFKTINQERWEEGDRNYNACFGDPNQLFINDYYFINYGETMVETLVGISSEENKLPNFIPVNDDLKTPEQLNKLYIMCNNRLDYTRKLMHARKLTAIGGECLVQIFHDTSKHPMGYPNVRVIPYNRYMTDDTWEDKSMSDGTFIMTQDWKTRPRAAQMFPKYKDRILATNFRSEGELNFSFDYRNNYEDVGRDNYIRVLRLWFKSTKEEKYLFNTRTGEVYLGEFDESLLRGSNTPLEIRKYKKPYWKMGIIVGSIPIGVVPNPLGFDACPFIPYYYTRHMELGYSRSRGLMHKIRDSIRIANRKILVSHDMADNPNNDLMVINNAMISNHNDIYNNYKRHKILNMDNLDMKASDAIYKQPYPGVPPSDLQLMQLSVDAITKSSGITETLMGTAKQDRVTTSTSILRDSSSKQAFAEVFKNWSASDKQWAKVWMAYIQANWDANRVKQEIREEPSQGFLDRNFSDYDVAITQTEHTDSSRNLAVAALMEIMQYADIKPRASTIAKLSNNISEETVQELEQREEQQLALSMEERQVNMQFIEEKIKATVAQQFLTMQRGYEREDRRDANRGLYEERLTQALKNEADAINARADAIQKLSLETTDGSKKIETQNYEKVEQDVKESDDEIREKDKQIERENEREVEEKLGQIPEGENQLNVDTP